MCLPDNTEDVNVNVFNNRNKYASKGDKNCEIDEYFKYCSYIKSRIDHLVIMCDVIIDTSDTVLIYSIDKKATYIIDYYIFHIFLLAAIFLLLLINIGINCYYITHRLKQIRLNILLYKLYKMTNNDKLIKLT